MIKTHYQKELQIKHELQIGSRGKDVQKVQEWLNIWRYLEPQWHHAVTIDGKFGPQTETVLKAFQEYQDLPAHGQVDTATFEALSMPMQQAFAPIKGIDIHELIIAYAQQHLHHSPVELNSCNEGPWVRAYMDGNEGIDWPWCVGFMQTVLDQAFSTLDQDFRTSMPHTYSCDVVGQMGLRNNRLIRNKQARQEPRLIHPGDLFLIVRTPHDWTHVGIIIRVEGDWLFTIEGNTNAEGSCEGIEVRQRMRNYRTHHLDIVKVTL